MQIFQVDFTALTFTIKTNEISKIGTYNVFYEVALKNYISVKKSSTTPIVVTIS
jgi:hypothetical protein